MQQHEAYCQQKALGHTDAAKRIADIYNLHRVGAGSNAIGRYFASRLSDGTSDNVLYDSKRDAVIHQHHNEKHYTFICIGPQSMRVCDAEVMLKVARACEAKGIGMADPEHARGGAEVIKRLTNEDQLAQAGGRNTNLSMPWEA